jgi:hypothetical protein
MNKKILLLIIAIIILTFSFGTTEAADAFIGGFEDSSSTGTDGFNLTVWNNSEQGDGNDVQVSTAHVYGGTYAAGLNGESGATEAALSIEEGFLNMTGYSGCTLNFWFYVGGNQGTNDHLYTDIYDGTWNYAVNDIVGEDYDSGDAAWRERTVSLSGYNMTEGFRVRWDAESSPDNNEYFVDSVNLSCTNYNSATASVDNITATPSTIKGGDTITIMANTTSHGIDDVDGDTLQIVCDITETPTLANSDCTGGTTSDGSNPYDLTCEFAVDSDDEEHTVYCRIHDGYDYSDVVNTTYTTDSSAPSTSVNSVAGDTDASYFDTINEGTTDINITGEADMNCRWSSSDLAYSSMSNACTIQGDTANCSVNDVGAQGFYTRYVACQDSLANEQTNATNLNVQFYLDYTAPTTSDNSNTNIQIPDYTITITETDNVDSDPVTLYCTDTAGMCNPSSPIDDAGTITFTSANRGTNYLLYNSTDDAGNQQTTVNVTININQLPNITSATDDATTIAGGTIVNVSTVSSDADGQSLTLYVCNETGATSSGCNGGEYCNDTNTTNIECTFTAESDSASHTWYAYIFDSLGEAAADNPQSGSYTTDVTAPTITINSPTADTTYPQSSLTFTITVDEGLTNAWYSINGTENVSMSNSSAVEWTQTNTSIDNGNYNVTFWANDSYGNIKTSATIEFIIDTTSEDETAPTVTIWGPVNNTYYLTNSILINITTDENASWAGYTNNSGTLTNLENTSETNWNKTITLGEGEHNITIYANDTSSNNNQGNNTVTIWVDLNNASITDFACDNNFNDSQNITCIANFTDAIALNYALIGYNVTGTWTNCTQSTLSGTSDSANCTIESTDTSPGNFTAEVYVYDNTGQFNWSSIEVNVSDDTNPSIDNVSYAPNISDNLDPYTQINFTTDITEDYLISSVNLMYYNESSTSWISVAMTNTSATRYNASFIPENGTWVFKINATDLQGNENVTSNTTLVVENDTSSNISTTIPLAKSITLTDATNNNTLGDINLNNTGETSLNFTVNITSTIETIFSINYTNNQTMTYSASAGEEINISMDANTTALDAGLYYYNITITSADGTDVLEKILNIQSSTAPYLSVSIDTYNASVEPNDNISLIASVQNLGTADATGVDLNWTLPDDWTITSGSQNKTIGNLPIDGTGQNSITVTIGTSEGSETIIASASASGGISDSDSKEVVVGTDTVTIIGGGDSGGGGGSSGGGGGSSASEYRETSEILEIVRGTTKEFPITINNIYKDSVIDNVTVTAQGYFPQHIKIRPESISGIQYGQNKTLNLIIYAPDYLDQGNYSLKLTIKGAIVQNDVTKSLIDKRALLLIVQEYDREEILLCQNESMQHIEDMKYENFSIAKVEKLLEGLDNAINLRDNNLALGYCTRIQEAKINAFLTAELILEVNNGIEQAEARRLEVPETKELLSLALAAFGREDYETAQERIKDAQMSLFLETKGRINMLWFLMTYWWLIIIAILSLAVTAYFLYKEILEDIINRKIKNLRREETTINKLIKAAQKKTYDLKKMSSGEYHKVLFGYETRINKIKQERSKLRHRRVALLSKEEEIKDINKEHKDITNLIKNTQRKYFEKGKISRQRYLKDTAGHEERLAEIEEERATLETKVAREKEEPKLFPIDYIKNIFKSNKKIKIPKKIKPIKQSKLERNVSLKAAIREAKKPLFKKLKLRKLKLKKSKTKKKFFGAKRQTILTKEQKEEYDDHLKRLGLKIK